VGLVCERQTKEDFQKKYQYSKRAIHVITRRSTGDIFYYKRQLSRVRHFVLNDRNRAAFVDTKYSWLGVLKKIVMK